MTRVNVLSIDTLQTTDLVAEAPTNNKATSNGEFSKLVDDQVQSQQANTREQHRSLKREDQQPARKSDEAARSDARSDQSTSSASEQSNDKLSSEASNDDAKSNAAHSSSNHKTDDQSAGEAESSGELSKEAANKAELVNTQTDKLDKPTNESALKLKEHTKPDDFMTLLAKSEQLLGGKTASESISNESNANESNVNTADAGSEDAVAKMAATKTKSDSENSSQTTSALGAKQAGQGSGNKLEQLIASHLPHQVSKEGEAAESSRQGGKLAEEGLAQAKADAAQSAKSQVVTTGAGANGVVLSAIETAEGENTAGELTGEQIANAKSLIGDSGDSESGLSPSNLSSGNLSSGNQSSTSQLPSNQEANLSNLTQAGKGKTDANGAVAGQTSGAFNQNGVANESTKQVLDAEQSLAQESDVQLAASQLSSAQQSVSQQKSANSSGAGQPSAHVQQLNEIANDGAEEQLAQNFNDAEQQAAEMAKQSETEAQQAQISGQTARPSFAASFAAANAGQPTATSSTTQADSLTNEQIERLEAVSSKVIDSNLDIKKAQQLQTETINIYRRDFAEAVKDKVMVMVNQKLQQVDIQLDPPELGNVHVRVNLQGDQAAVNFTVQNPQAKDALEQHMDKLRDMLQESGVDVGDANVAQQQQGNGQQQGRMAQGNGAADEVTTLPDNIAQLVKGSATGIDFYA